MPPHMGTIATGTTIYSFPLHTCINEYSYVMNKYFSCSTSCSHTCHYSRVVFQSIVNSCLYTCMYVRIYMCTTFTNTHMSTHTQHLTVQLQYVVIHTLQRRAEMQDMLYHHKPMVHSITSLGGYHGQDENTINST